MGSPSSTERANEGIRPQRFTAFAWGVLGYTLFVILFGAVVRITGSGAGCGQHWPTCRGEVAHLPQTVETTIELTHRITSGLSFFLVVGILIVALRSYPRAHLARRAAWAAMITMIIEVLVGAALVLLALVANDDSVARACVMALHLINTFLLAASLTLVAWSSQRKSIRLAERESAAAFALVSVAVLLVSVSGAVTALGDTVRPPQLGVPTLERLQLSYNATAHFLDRLRALHPALAAGMAALIIVLATRLAERFRRSLTEKLLYFSLALTLVQSATGILNIWLLAPGWLQVIHLTLALGLWSIWILAWASAPPKASSI